MLQTRIIDSYQKLLCALVNCLAAPLRPSPRKLRNVLLYLSLCALFGMLVFSVYQGNAHMQRNRLICMLLLELSLVCCASLQRPRNISIPRYLALAWLLISASQAVAAVAFGSGEYLCAFILSSVLIPQSWILARSNEGLLAALNWAILALFIFILTNCLLLHPVEAARYEGFMNNSNTFSFVLLPCLPFLLLNSIGDKPLAKRLPYCALAGLCAALLVLAGSRSALLSALLCLALCFFFQKNAKALLLSLGALLFCAALGIGIFCNFSGLMEKMTQQAMADEYSAELVLDDAQTNTDASSLHSAWQGIWEHLSLGFEGSDFSNNRIFIWKSYLPQLGFMGHSPDDSFRDSLGPGANTAHNAALQTAYDFGILAGLALLFLQLAIPLSLLCSAIRERKSAFDPRRAMLYIACAMALCFSTVMLVEGIYKPYVNLLPLLFWTLSFPVAAGQKEK